MTAERLAEADDWRSLAEEHRVDVYLLPPHAPDLLPKVRGGRRFEIKHRREVRDGLEQWEMPVSEPTPLDRRTRDKAAELLGRALPADLAHLAPFERDGWTTARVAKTRRRWCRDETTVEVTWTSLGWTIAAEEPDHGTLLRLARSLRLHALPNQDYGARIRFTSGSRSTYE